MLPAASALQLRLVLVTRPSARTHGDGPALVEAGAPEGLATHSTQRPVGNFTKCPPCSRSGPLPGGGPSEGHLGLPRTPAASSSLLKFRGRGGMLKGRGLKTPPAALTAGQQCPHANTQSRRLGPVTEITGYLSLFCPLKRNTPAWVTYVVRLLSRVRL